MIIIRLKVTKCDRSDCSNSNSDNDRRVWHAGNKFFQDHKPWEAIKSDKELCGSYLAACMGLVALLAALLHPYMPSVTRKVCPHKVNNGLSITYRLASLLQLMCFPLHERLIQDLSGSLHGPFGTSGSPTAALHALCHTQGMLIHNEHHASTLTQTNNDANTLGSIIHCGWQRYCNPACPFLLGRYSHTQTMVSALLEVGSPVTLHAFCDLKGWSETYLAACMGLVALLAAVL